MAALPSTPSVAVNAMAQRQDVIHALQRALRAFRRWGRVTRGLFIAAFVTCAIWGALVWVFAYYEDEFPRAGAGLLILSTFVTLLHLRARERLQGAMTHLPKSLSGGVRLTENSEENRLWNRQDDLAQACLEEGRALMAQELRQVLRWYAVLGMLGATVWAFGDLVFCYAKFWMLRCS